MPHEKPYHGGLNPEATLEAKITKAAREELARAVRTRYQAATGKAKHDIPSEFIAISGYHPKYAIEVLNREDSGLRPLQRRSRARLYDDAAMESFWTTLKTDTGPDEAIPDSRRHTELAIFDYIETFYNPTRRHSSLGNVSPMVFEK